MKVLIGCPIYERAWILPYWFKAIEEQGWPEEDLGFCFIYGPSKDDTLKILLEYQRKHPKHFAFEILENIQEQHKSHHESGVRSWSISRYESLTRLRNQLLEHVSAINPDMFLTLDSDIILETPNALERFIEDLSIYDVVGLLTFMTLPPAADFPSVMSWRQECGGRAHRTNDYPLGTLFDSDIVMAGKAMKPEVFKEVRYLPHPQGEDLGFCTLATQFGYKIGCDSRIFGAHVMGSIPLFEYIRSGDPRRIISEQKALLPT